MLSVAHVQAKILTGAGHRVVCACRNREKADSAARAALEYAQAAAADTVSSHFRPGGEATGEVCDLSDLSSVRAFAKRLREIRPRGVGTLALNAGLALSTSEKEPRRTADGFELTVGVNHLGHFALTLRLLPLLALAPTGHLDDALPPWVTMARRR